jgi:hypothetical protein
MILVVLSFFVAIPVVAQGPVDADIGGSDVDAPAEDAAPANDAPVDVAPVESSVGDSDVDAPAEDAAPADDAVAAPVDAVDETLEEFDPIGAGPGEVGGDSVEAADVVEPESTLDGSFTTDVIAIANLGSAAGTPNLSMYKIIDGTENTPAVGAISPGGVTFVNSSALAEGEWSGVLSSDFPAAVAVLISNGTAGVGDAYTGFGDDVTAKELVGTLIYNKHSSLESTFYCQNAGSAAATIKAELYKVGEATPKATIESSSLTVGRGVKWDVGDNSAIQTQWPGKQKEFGYVKFSSTENIACVVDNQRIATPGMQSIYSAVPQDTSMGATKGFAGKDLRIPLLFNGHGGSSDNASRGTKWQGSINIVNVSAATANAEVKFTAIKGGYEQTCKTAIVAGSSVVWYAPQIGTGAGTGADWTCTPDGALPWPNDANNTYSYGSAVITSDNPILAVVNSDRNDGGSATVAAIAAGYTGQGISPDATTTKAACPLAYNKDANTSWVTGVQAANVGDAPTKISFKMVKAGTDPTVAGNTVTLESSADVPVGGLVTAYFPNPSDSISGTPFTDFEGAVFVESTSSKIAVNNSTVSYVAASAGALYDCISY